MASSAVNAEGAVTWTCHCGIGGEREKADKLAGWLKTFLTQKAICNFELFPSVGQNASLDKCFPNNFFFIEYNIRLLSKISNIQLIY